MNNDQPSVPGAPENENPLPTPSGAASDRQPHGGPAGVPPSQRKAAEQAAEIASQEGKNTPPLPDGSYAISAADKAQIVKLGRELQTFFLHYAKENNIHMHVKLAVGAFNYVTEMHRQKAQAIGDFLDITQDSFIQNEVVDLVTISEPYTDTDPVPAGIPSADVTAPAADPAAPATDPEVDAASVAPASAPVPSPYPGEEAPETPSVA